MGVGGRVRKLASCLENIGPTLSGGGRAGKKVSVGTMLSLNKIDM